MLLPRNAHHSAIQACILGGLIPAWIPVRQRKDGYCYIAQEDVLTTLQMHPEAKTLLLTRPDYFGGCIPLEEIISCAHSLGIKVAVDEAHGAHLPWMESPSSAGPLGVDGWVQSVHKTLPGLTGCAVLHLRDAADKSAALRICRREQTSSPSFLFMQAIDDARAWMDAHPHRLADCVQAVQQVQRALPSLGYADAHALWQETGLDFDPSRLVIHAPQGGQALSDSLQ